MERKYNHNSTWLKLLSAFCVISAMAFYGCSNSASSTNKKYDRFDSLKKELQQIADAASGKVGVAVITSDGDTLKINNDSHYQLMSVFKLHEALAVSHILDIQGISLDSIISFSRSELDPDTWSPMLKEHKETEFNIPVSELIRYIIQLSDNNASNLLFDRIVSVKDCEDFIHKSTDIKDFSINYTERQMHSNPSLADGNHSSPLACAELMEKIFSDSIVSSEKQTVLQRILLDCQTGQDRIFAPLKDKHGVTLAHKTGSGFRNERGELTAHNDVGRVVLPDGRHYVLAVMVKDFKGSEEQASAIIAKISAAVFNFINHTTTAFNISGAH